MTKNLKTLELLIAEDDDILRTLFVKQIGDYFFNIYEARDGEEAWKIYKDHKPSVIFLDIEMPKLNGIDLAKKIRNIDNQTLIVIITSHSDKEKILEAIELNLVKYLIKPVRLKDMLMLLDSIKLKIDKTQMVSFANSMLWDLEKKILIGKEGEIKLTKCEIRLLDLLTSKNGKIFSNEDIFSYVWYDDFDREYNVSSIKILIRNIRKKLPPNAIINIYGEGYKLN